MYGCSFEACNSGANRAVSMSSAESKERFDEHDE